MDIKVTVDHLSGIIDPIASKSTIHRSLICALLSRSVTTINNINFSKDVLATISVLEKLNCQLNVVGNNLIVDSINIKKSDSYLNCAESGSTLRFIIPVLIYLFDQAKVDGEQSLKNRPLDVYLDLFAHDSLQLPIEFRAKLQPKTFELPGDISSQFISGLLFVLPLLEKNSIIKFTKPLESAKYVDLTIDVLSKFGIKITKENNQILINGLQEYQKNITYDNEIDESNLAFFKVANDFGCKIRFSDFNKVTHQPDYICDELIQTKPDIIDVSEFPDLLPILCLLFSFKSSPTKLINAKRTKIKESNRLVTMALELNKMGGKITVFEDSLIVNPVKKFNPAIVDSHNDHRIAMSLVIAALKADYIVLNNAQAIDKSYPEFLQVISDLGAKIEIL